MSKMVEEAQLDVEVREEKHRQEDVLAASAA